MVLSLGVIPRCNPGVSILKRERPQRAAQLQTASDVFVRFQGAPDTRRQEQVMRIVQAIHGLPGAQPVQELLMLWIQGVPKSMTEDWGSLEKRFLTADEDAWLIRPGARSEDLLTEIEPRLLPLISAHIVPPRTIRVAMDAGLQSFVDDALSHFAKPEAQRKKPLHSKTTKTGFSLPLQTVGLIGSSKMIPLLELYLVSQNPAQSEEGFWTLRNMASRFLPYDEPTARIEADQALERHKSIITRRQLDKLKENPLDVQAFLILGTYADAPPAVEALAKAWDDSKNLPALQRDDVRLYVLTGWMEMIRRGVPGAMEALEDKREEIEPFLELTTVYAEAYDERVENTTPVRLLYAGLVGDHISDLPGKTWPAGLNVGRGRYPWPYAEETVSNFLQLLHTADTMAKRKVPGAGAMRSDYQSKLDNAIISELDGLIQGLSPGKPSHMSDFYSAIRFFHWTGKHAGARVLPALRRIQEQPWHASVAWDIGNPSPSPYTRQSSEVAKDLIAWLVESVRQEIELRQSEGKA